MGRSAKMFRLQSHVKAKKVKKGEKWRESGIKIARNEWKRNVRDASISELPLHLIAKDKRAQAQILEAAAAANGGGGGGGDESDSDEGDNNINKSNKNKMLKSLKAAALKEQNDNNNMLDSFGNTIMGSSSSSSSSSKSNGLLSKHMESGRLSADNPFANLLVGGSISRGNANSNSSNENSQMVDENPSLMPKSGSKKLLSKRIGKALKRDKIKAQKIKMMKNRFGNSAGQN